MRRVHALATNTRGEGKGREVTSMVGLPRESRISRAEMSLIVAARSVATPCRCLLCFRTVSAGGKGQK